MTRGGDSIFELNGISKEEAMSYLPKRFVEVFGTGLSSKGLFWLIENHGGTCVYIPKPGYAAKGKLAGMPEDDIQRLYELAGNGSILVPTGDALRKRLRDMKIFRKRSMGKSESLVAREFNMSCRNVRRINEKLRAEQSIRSKQ